MEMQIEMEMKVEILNKMETKDLLTGVASQKLYVKTNMNDWIAKIMMRIFHFYFYL